MERVILIKYGELTTKKGNRNFFVNLLYKSIQNKLSGYNVKIFKDLSRMYIEFNDNDLDEILKRVNNIFGIHEYLVAYKINTLEEEIKSKALEIVKKEKFNTFKVETKRSYKEFPIHSQDFSRMIGGIILKNIDNISNKLSFNGIVLSCTPLYLNILSSIIILYIIIPLSLKY